jgi:hypothetical protein
MRRSARAGQNEQAGGQQGHAQAEHHARPGRKPLSALGVAQLQGADVPLVQGLQPGVDARQEDVVVQTHSRAQHGPGEAAQHDETLLPAQGAQPVPKGQHRAGGQAHLPQGQGRGQGVQILKLPLSQTGKRSPEMRGGRGAPQEARGKTGGLRPLPILALHLRRQLRSDEEAEPLVQQGPGPGEALPGTGSAVRAGRVGQGEPGMDLGAALDHMAQGLRARGQAQVHGHCVACGEKPPEVGQEPGGLALGVAVAVGRGIVRADDHQRTGVLGAGPGGRKKQAQGQQKGKGHGQAGRQRPAVGGPSRTQQGVCAQSQHESLLGRLDHVCGGVLQQVLQR